MHSISNHNDDDIVELEYKRDPPPPPAADSRYEIVVALVAAAATLALMALGAYLLYFLSHAFSWTTIVLSGIGALGVISALFFYTLKEEEYRPPKEEPHKILKLGLIIAADLPTIIANLRDQINAMGPEEKKELTLLLEGDDPKASMEAIFKFDDTFPPRPEHLARMQNMVAYWIDQVIKHEKDIQTVIRELDEHRYTPEAKEGIYPWQTS